MQEIRDLVNQSLRELKLDTVDPSTGSGQGYSVTHPKEESHGDYSVNVAMVLAKKMGKNPREVAEMILKQVQDDKGPTFVKNFDKIEVAGAGFINFYLKPDFFLAQTKKAVVKGYGKNESLAGQRTMVEFTDPNPFKEFHIGHLMSNTIGESLCRIFEASGAEVQRVNYQGDIGLHVAKSIWGWQRKMSEDGMTLELLGTQTIKERVVYLGAAYAHGATKYEEDEGAKAEMNALNKVIYDKSDKVVDELYMIGRKWSLEYFETIYQRLGTKFEQYFFESEEGPKGLKIVEEGLAQGVLQVGEAGAVVFKGEQYGLHTRVFRNKLGLPTYEAKELALPRSKYERWAYDKSFIITANEIDEYFKVLLKVLSLLSPELGAKTTHLSHGIMKLTTGKMSSRTGKVVTGEGLLNELKEVVLQKMGDPSSPKASTRQGRELLDKDAIADQVAVGALKYSVLRQAVGGDIVYDPEKMTNLEGNTGPFVQYTHARARSILRKVKSADQRISGSVDQLVSTPVEQEMKLLRWIYRYPETVSEATSHYAPHLVATYIYELAQRFNSFYQACRVEEKGEVNPLRYLLTEASANVLESGLGLLGIQAPSEM